MILVSKLGGAIPGLLKNSHTKKARNFYDTDKAYATMDYLLAQLSLTLVQPKGHVTVFSAVVPRLPQNKFDWPLSNGYYLSNGN